MLPCIFNLCLQLGLGVAHATPQDCGIWYTCGPDQPHTLHLDGLDWSAGITDDTKTWRLGYEDAGNTSVESRVPAFIGQYPGPMAQFNGSGTLRGFYATYTHCWDKWCGEVGPWIYKAHWAETLIGLPGRPTIYEDAGKFAPGEIVAVRYRFNDSVDFVLSERSANNRGVAADGGLLQSITKGFTTSFTIQVTP